MSAKTAQSGIGATSPRAAISAKVVDCTPAPSESTRKLGVFRDINPTLLDMQTVMQPLRLNDGAMAKVCLDYRWAGGTGIEPTAL